MVGDNMFFLGLFAGIVFLLLIYAAFHLGTKYNKQTKVTVDDEDKRKQEQLYKGFVELMRYDVNTAMQRKEVTHE